MQDKVPEFNSLLEGSSPEVIIRFFAEKYTSKVCFSTSLGAEDQVLTRMVAENAPMVKIFTLDTGRHFAETYETLDRTIKKYNLNIEIFFPDRQKVEDMVNKKGINLFYESIENRKLCCNIRKVEPLNRALKGNEVWITGLRREQSVTRSNDRLVQLDEHHSIIKVNPLIEWTEDNVRDYLKQNKVPYNVLHDQGYPSIGCQPCTRAILPGEDVRAGRWWWENPEMKECGIHKNSH
ncbi:phosphoadenylyl-sulfate reductase [Bacteroidota bacterium]